MRAGSLPRTVPAFSAFLTTASSSPKSASTPTLTLMAFASLRSSLLACLSAAASCCSSSLTSAVAPLAWAFASLAVSLSTSFCALSILAVKSSVDTDSFAFLVSRVSIFFEIASIWRLTLWSSRSSPRTRIALASSLDRLLVSSSMSASICSRPDEPPPDLAACFRKSASAAVAPASLPVSRSISAVSTPTVIDPPAAFAALICWLTVAICVFAFSISTRTSITGWDEDIWSRSSLTFSSPPKRAMISMSLDLSPLIASRRADTLDIPVVFKTMSTCRFDRAEFSLDWSESKSLIMPGKPLNESFIDAAAWSDRSNFWSGV